MRNRTENQRVREIEREIRREKETEKSSNAKLMNGQRVSGKKTWIFQTFDILNFSSSRLKIGKIR